MTCRTDARLCFVGAMTGRNRGFVTTQGERLTDLFTAAGYPVLSVSAHPNRYGRLLDIVTTLVRQGRRIDVQVLQVFGGPSFVMEDAASLIGRSFGQRIIMVLRGGAMPQFMARFPGWCRRVLNRADVLVVPSAYLARALAQQGFESEIIPNIIELDRYPFRWRQSVEPRLLWLRAFHRVYHPEMAIRVLAQLRRQVPDATLTMGGVEMDLGPAVRELARELEVSDAVRFAGFMDMNDKVREGQASDIYLNTNRIDNTPVTVLEMCAMGLPVVATAVGGVPDLISDGENGLLVPNEDVEAMTEAVLRLLREPSLAARLSQNGRALAEAASWERVRPQWEGLFARVLEGRA